MRPLRLKLSNFTSFRDGADVPFADLDRFAICGPTGAGKSSLLDGLTIALFADAPRRGAGNLDNLIALASTSLAVPLDFRAGDQPYRGTRGRRRTGTGTDQLERLLDPERTELVASGARAVTAAVERLLGLKYDHFTQAIFLPQGKFAEFLKAKTSEKQLLLNELLRLLVYERMRERAARESHSQAARKE